MSPEVVREEDRATYLPISKIRKRAPELARVKNFVPTTRVAPVTPATPYSSGVAFINRMRDRLPDRLIEEEKYACQEWNHSTEGASGRK